MTPISAEELRASLSPETDRALAALEIFDVVGSTNAVLAAANPPAAGTWHVAIADEQTAGRGRGDNRWRSSPGAGLWMSAAYTFRSPPTQVASLTLALGVSLAEAIEKLCGANLRLKWPNDLILNDGKLGGMLIELTDSGRTVICGIGINFQAPDAGSLGDPAALPPIGLAEALASPPSRTRLAAQILDAANITLPRFVESGLEPWLERWPRYDWLLNQDIVALQGERESRGIARGIDADGALRLEDEGRIERIVSASIRRDDSRTPA